MPTTGELWPNLYTGNADRVHKWLYGSVLIRDWDPAGTTSFSSFSPFADDGNLRTDLFDPALPGGRWYEIGTISEKGVEFTPKFTTADTKSWQSRRSLRNDVTEDDEEVMFEAMESTPLIDLLKWNMPLTQLVAVGSANYRVTQPFFTDTLYRQILVIGVDGTVDGSNCEYIVEGRPRVSLNKKAKRTFAAKEVDAAELTYSVYVDPASGSSPAYLWRGGTVWAGEGGATVFPAGAPVATAVSGDKATVAFSEPTSPNSPFTYVVNMTTGSTTTVATQVGSPVVSGSTVTITVSGLTTGSAYTFTVTATGSNAATATTVASNSVTAIA